MGAMTERQELNAQWHLVRESQARLDVHLTAAYVRGAFWLDEVRTAAFAFMLPFAFTVLERALQAFGEEGAFKCKRGLRQVGPLMKASVGSDSFTWCDYAAVASGLETRDALVHHHKLPTVARTLEIVDLIERELVGWRVLEGPVVYKMTLTVGQSSP
jgi:hypothetical protein